MFDMHTHFIPRDVMHWLKDHQDQAKAKWEKRGPDQTEFLIVDGKWGFELKEAFLNPTLYLTEQKAAAVTHSLVSPIPQLFLYDFPPELTQEIASIYNQSLAAWTKEHPARLSALATLPLNLPQMAACELRQAMTLGLKGAIIGPGLANHLLTDPFFTPLWEEANHQSAILFIHPLLAEDPRLQKRMMPNLIGIPWETTICATDILLSGLLDRYPNVKILLAHGGGFLPYQIGRLHKGYEKWSAVSSPLQAPPLDYLRRFWYDNVLWSSESLDFLTQTVGEEKIVPGSDYPFDLCAWPPACTNEVGVKSLLGLGLPSE